MKEMTDELQDRMLREHFSEMRGEEMPAGLGARIMENARAAQQERFSLGKDKWGVVFAAVFSVLLIGTALWLAYDMMPDMSGFKLTLPKIGHGGMEMPKIDLGGAKIWIMIAGTALILLVGESLLLRHFANKRDLPS